MRRLEVAAARRRRNEVVSAVRIAAELGLSLEDVLKDAVEIRAMIAAWWSAHPVVMRPDGFIDIEPLIRCLAEQFHLDADGVLAEARQLARAAS